MVQRVLPRKAGLSLERLECGTAPPEQQEVVWARVRGRSEQNWNGWGRMVDLLNVKCDPVLIGSLLLKDGFFPAYHMSKDNWVSILLDDRVNDEIIKDHMSGCFPLSVWYFRQSTDF